MDMDVFRFADNWFEVLYIIFSTNLFNPFPPALSIGPKNAGGDSESSEDYVEEGLLQAASVDRKNNCLGRDRWRDRPAIKSCTINPLSSSIWKYNFDTGKLYSSGVISSHFGTTCIVERFDGHDGSKIGLGSCSKFNYLPLRFVQLHPDGSANSKYGALKNFDNGKSPFSTSSTTTAVVVLPMVVTNTTEKAVEIFKCPTTMLPFPLRLYDSYNGSSQNINSRFQTFAGVGHYTKVRLLSLVILLFPYN